MKHDEFLQVLRNPFHFATCDAVLRGCKIVNISKPLQWRRLSKKVCSPLGPLCEGAPPAGGGGEHCTAPEIFRAMAKFSPSAPSGHRSPSGASATSPVSGESVSQREASLAVCLISVKYHYNNPYYSTHFCVLRFLTNTTL